MLTHSLPHSHCWQWEGPAVGGACCGRGLTANTITLIHTRWHVRSRSGSVEFGLLWVFLNSKAGLNRSFWRSSQFGPTHTHTEPVPLSSSTSLPEYIHIPLMKVINSTSSLSHSSSCRDASGAAESGSVIGPTYCFLDPCASWERESLLWRSPWGASFRILPNQIVGSIPESVAHNTAAPATVGRAQWAAVIDLFKHSPQSKNITLWSITLKFWRNFVLGVMFVLHSSRRTFSISKLEIMLPWHLLLNTVKHSPAIWSRPCLETLTTRGSLVLIIR